MLGLNRKHLATAAVVAVAIAIVLYMYRHYVLNPWTRDGQVRAQVIQIVPRVSGPIINLPIKDNASVKQGDLLWQIDPRTFQAALDQASAQLSSAQAQLDEAKDEEHRARRIRKKNPGAMSVEDMNARVNARKGAEAGVKLAEAAQESARLDLEFCDVKAPVDGYVTNLRLRLGSQAVANSPALALVDVNSYWIDGYFRENYIADIRRGDRAVVTLMTYPDKPVEGVVDSIGWGIAQSDGSTGENLLPTISPTFEWIRLAQRVPVRVHVTELPEGVELRVGTTGSVLVMTGTASETDEEMPLAAPEPLL
ncbi:HlyD family secretion protein [Corallincola spongiicola]|uniref:HlyD family secretion protein n=1 Tax=Corallincola spongiicola TaxID=2520508 RepID=A0ABY1WLX5_9GAMM|nr:HlyD family secretion protein [Corallincola spongiicola]TAA42600.1 HlyD family secretion protein [Corallincola spongiicola]